MEIGSAQFATTWTSLEVESRWKDQRGESPWPLEMFHRCFRVFMFSGVMHNFTKYTVCLNNSIGFQVSSVSIYLPFS